MGLKVFINNEEVWESEGDATLVTQISGLTRKGEFGRLGVANDIDRVDLLVSVRDEVESASDLDVRGDTVARIKNEDLENALSERGERSAGSDANLLHNEALEASRVPNETDHTESADADSEEAGNTPSSPATNPQNTPGDEGALSTPTGGAGIRLGG